MIPATIGASVYQFNIFVSTLLASLLTEGSISWLFYADRVAQFPVGIFSVALASVLLPMLANASATSNVDQFRSGLSNSLRFTSFAIIPMAAGIWVLAVPLTSLLFERGAFTHHSTLMTAAAIQALAIGLWASSCYSMVMRAFIAKKDTITPTLIGVCSLVVYLASALILMGRVNQAAGTVASIIAAIQNALYSVFPTVTAQGHVGLALASSIGALFSLVFAIVVYTVKLGNFPWSTFLRSFATSIAASCIMIAAVRMIAPFEAAPLMTTLIGATVGVVAYILSSVILRSKEMTDTLALVRRKLSRG
jgi:putative peptidoglycan lipid II flippase